MMNTIRQQLFTGWHFMRWLRLGMGILIIVQAVEIKNAFIGIIGAFFFLQSITGSGCCGANGCTLPVKIKEENEKDLG